MDNFARVHFLQCTIVALGWVNMAEWRTWFFSFFFLSYYYSFATNSFWLICIFDFVNFSKPQQNFSLLLSFSIVFSFLFFWQYVATVCKLFIQNMLICMSISSTPFAQQYREKIVMSENYWKTTYSKIHKKSDILFPQPFLSNGWLYLNPL